MGVLLGGGGEKNWKGYVSCEKHHDYEKPGCGAVMEVEEGDLILMYWEDGSSEHFYPAVRCVVREIQRGEGCPKVHL